MFEFTACLLPLHLGAVLHRDQWETGDQATGLAVRRVVQLLGRVSGARHRASPDGHRVAAAFVHRARQATRLAHTANPRSERGDPLEARTQPTTRRRHSHSTRTDAPDPASEPTAAAAAVAVARRQHLIYCTPIRDHTALHHCCITLRASTCTPALYRFSRFLNILDPQHTALLHLGCLAASRVHATADSYAPLHYCLGNPAFYSLILPLRASLVYTLFTTERCCAQDFFSFRTLFNANSH